MSTLTRVEILLSADQMANVRDVGEARQRQARRANKGSKFIDSASTRTAQEIEGAGAEFAVCIDLGVTWNPQLTPRDWELPDIPPDWQVRSTHHRNGRLCVQRTRDKDNHRFVLVTAAPPLFTIVGWLPGRDAKRDEWWTDLGRGWLCYAVPQDALHDWADR